MTLTEARADDRARPKPTTSGWFRAFWRWHFYASFVVAPILLILATTGLIYLFRFEIEPLMHGDLMNAEQPADIDIKQPYAAQQAAVERAYPDATIEAMTEPGQFGDSTRFSILTESGEPRDVYVNPWGAEVLGDINPDQTLSGYAIRVHGELMAGKWGDHVIELGACWAIVMALTGYYLFVKGRAARIRRSMAKAAGARLTSWHAWVGAVVGVGLLTLLVTGLPWTGFWGDKAQNLATDNGQSFWSVDPGAASDPTSRLDESLPHSHAHEAPWAQGGAEVPESQGDPGEHGANVANVDTVIKVAEDEGLRHPMTVTIPGGGGGGHGGHAGGSGDGVFSVIGYAFDAPSEEKTVHVDQYGGEAVATYGFDDYPMLAKVVSQGIGLHEGRSLGLWSFWGAALMCAAIIFACISGPLMWWKRRPSGSSSVGAPRGRLPLRASPLLLVGLIALGIFLPLFGLSLLLVLVFDQLVLRRVPAMGEWFNVT